MSEHEHECDGGSAGKPDEAAEPSPVPPAEVFCLNCETPLPGAFCGNCGQKRITGSLRTSEVARDLWSAAVDVDRGFLRTFVGLVRAPGPTVAEYVDGRRAVHAPPFRYFLILLAAWVAFPALIGFDFTEYAARAMEEARGAFPDDGSGTSSALSGLLERYMAASFKMYEWRRWTTLVNLPLYAVGGWLLFRKRRRSFAEWTAFALYVSAQILVLGIVGFVLLALKLDVVHTILSLVTFPYVIWAYKGFSGESVLAATVKGLVVQFGGGIALSVLLLIVAFALTG